MDAKKPCKNNENMDEDDQESLLPALPNHLARLCLASLPPSLLYRVCKSWRRSIYSPNFPPFYSLYALLTPSHNSTIPHHCHLHSPTFLCFDPIAWKWTSLPPPPPLCMLSRHPSYISRILPIQSISASGKLLLIAANTHTFLPALTSPLVFNPLSRNWSFGPPFSTPRRWCVTGSVNGSVYVASGMGARYQRDVARSVERWDMSKSYWERKEELKDGKFSREAVEAVGYRGKLCMVNIKGKATKEGAVYDAVKDEWEEMPRLMLEGWRGAVASDGEEEEMYVIDEESGRLSKYDGDNDCWEEMMGPYHQLKGAEHLCAGRGKVCAVSGDGGKILVMDVSVRPVNIWTLDPPEGMEVVALHILPRMTTLPF